MQIFIFDFWDSMHKENKHGEKGKNSIFYDKKKN